MTTDALASETACPCQSGQPYAACCAPLHLGIQPAPTAEALMRARYSAYALRQVDYIIQTTHRENPQVRRNIKVWRAETVKYCQQTQFLGLEILNRETLSETKATVTFRASLARGEASFAMTEKSTFLKIGPRWLYHSGVDASE